MRWSALAALLLLLSPQTTLAQAVVTNVGIDASQGFILENGFVAFRVYESLAGVDLNGDTDTVDFVLHIYDTDSGRLTSTGVEASGQIYVNGDYLAWRVSEHAQGMVDLNGDNDTGDLVLHYVHMPSGTVTNTELAGTEPAIVGNVLGARVIESSQNEFLNGDDDKSDAVLHLIDLVTGDVTNVGVDAAAGFVIDGNRVVFAPFEMNERVDANGDGDQLDFVLHVWDGTTVTNLGLASQSFGFQLEGDLLAFFVSEAAQGTPAMPSGTVLNGDGDTSDLVMHVHDFASGVGGTTTNLGLAVRNGLDFQLNGGYVAMAVRESDQGVLSLNSTDTDTFDEVLHVFDAAAGTTNNLDYAVQEMQLDDGHLAFSVPEAGHGADLTGDGLQDDLVLHLYDTANADLQNLASDASLGFKLEGNMLLGFGAYEGNQGSDGNGDGDTADFTLYVFDISAGNLVNLAVDPSGGVETFLLDGKYVSFGVNEAAQGNTDFNGDSDTADVVLHYFNAETTLSTNLMLDARMGQQLQDGTIAFIVNEDAQGQTDLNGDGDASDFILHIAKLDADVAPSAQDLIDALIAHVQTLDLHPRIERNRVVMLRLAQRALNQDRPCLAMKFLRIFRWSVYKRAGHGIPTADASELIAEAGTIMDMLGENPNCAHGRH